MRTEIASAVDFLSNFMRTQELDPKQLESFRQTLHVVLCSHYQNHWFPEKPFKGSAYRCIRINGQMDPLIKKAGESCGLSSRDLYSLLPRELTMWIDPKDVSYRFGEDGSIGVIYSGVDNPESEPLVSSTPEVHFQNEYQQPSFDTQQQLCAGEYRQGLTPSFAFGSGHLFNMEYLAQYAS